MEREEHCCYANKATVWSRDPEGLYWEFYRVTGDTEDFGESTVDKMEAAAGARCCAGKEESNPASATGSS